MELILALCCNLKYALCQVSNFGTDHFNQQLLVLYALKAAFFTKKYTRIIKRQFRKGVAFYIWYMKPIMLAALLFLTFTGTRAQHSVAAAQVDSLLGSVYKEGLPGASVIIFQDGKTIFRQSYGVANIDTRQALTETSSFNICSLTKQFTALAILQLEESHKLSLDDKLSRFFPEMNSKVADAVTIQQLLTHSSGMIDHYSYTNTAGMQHAYNSDVYNAIKNIDSTYFTPGTQFRYSNTAYCLLALIIEKLSGISYNEYMQQRIFKLAGMMNTVIWNENGNIKNEVTGYAWDSAGRSFKVAGPGESIFFSTEGDGGVYTSISDYLQWFKALQTGKVFSQQIVEKARQMQLVINKEKRTGYGYGWFVDEKEAALKAYHSGSNGGFRTYSFTVPDKNIVLVIFSNRDDIDLETLVQKLVLLQWPGLKPFTRIEQLTF